MAKKPFGDFIEFLKLMQRTNDSSYYFIYGIGKLIADANLHKLDFINRAAINNLVDGLLSSSIRRLRNSRNAVALTAP